MSQVAAGLFASGHAADIVLAVMLAEGLWLAGRRGWRIADALALLLPGALILVALRAALTQSDWHWIALPLILSFPVHLADVARRQDRPRRVLPAPHTVGVNNISRAG